MEKTIQIEGVLTTGMAVYVKPTSLVYELEVEGAIMDTASGKATTTNYEYDSSTWA